MGDSSVMGDINFNKDSLEFENFTVTIEKRVTREKGDVAVDFSIKLTDLLEAKAKKHNSSSPDNEVSLKDLKSVYIKGAGDCSPAVGSGKTCGEWALVRVNMFLRQKLGGKMITGRSDLNVGALVDISETWIPSEEDLLKTKAEIEEHKLDYDFKNVNELYIEPYERLEIEW